MAEKLDISTIYSRIYDAVVCWDGEKRIEMARFCLDSFIGANFAGLLETKNPLELDVIYHLENLEGHSFSELSFNCNEPFVGVRVIQYLLLSREILSDKFFPLNFSLEKRFEWLLWRFRCYRFWSLILTEKSLELKALLYKQMDQLDTLIVDAGDDKPAWEILFQYELEKSAVKSEFFEHAEAKKSMEKAAELAEVNVQLGGALGRRTRFQEKSLAQLVVSIKSDGRRREFEKENIDVNLPLNCKNMDDTLLDRVRLDNGDEVHQLTEWEMLYLLQSGLEKYHAYTELDIETSLAFVEEIIYCRRNWAIQVRALIERSMLERKNKRRVERACSQMELICKLLDNIEDSATCKDWANEAYKERDQRLRLIYSTSPVSFWTAQCIHAEILLSLGCISEALKIYEFLNNWDEVVNCYKRLNQLEKAESIVRDMLLKEPKNVIYHCILGDITNHPDHYNTAIKVSNGKCARAHTSLGMLYLSRRNYASALMSFQRSVEIQPYQVGVWYNLGHCAMNLEKCQEAANAYHRCVMFEPEHFEAWNNLSACYVNLGQMERAQKIILESIKLKHDNWKVWENLLIISASINDFKTTIMALNKLMDMDAKRKIEELPLEIVVSNTLKLPAEEVKNFRELLSEILARLMARQSLSSKLLKLYAELKRPSAESTNLVSWSKYLQLLEKAVFKEISENSEKNDENFAKQLESMLKLIEAQTYVWRIKQMTESQIKMQIKLRLRPLFNTIEKVVGENCENSQSKRLKVAFGKATALL